ncbi:MAG: transcription termination/antitermination factor NusG [Ruminococcus sp.]|jgi:transcriptional antiterminator NusG|nr:transcription termination/antitermination factor NusG [Ruminococcus sp.]MBP8592948.1 transcription termination/antitermination factor NusG [Ruminococcus sp.]MBQ8123752.1 transcription termination/antitermination factor NusG [Ruminococcus sp.]HOO06218.1 transcription termination/antitermination protein NusG [Ruminococcus sp.]
MSEAAKWYVIHTYSGYENKVAQNIEKVVENRKLHDLIQEVRVPTERVTEITDGKSKEIERKTYPGYVLVKMVVTDDSWYVVRNTRGCTGFVGPASEPTPLTDEEVESLFGVDVSTVEVNFSVGDRVQISGTAMDGFIGVVQNINLEERTVDLLVSMFGRETPTTLPISQVITVED